eukprot:c27338_g1_i1 orf=341-1516(-)
MGAKMKIEKNSLVLLSSKRTKVDTRTRADKAFALPSFTTETTSIIQELPPHVCNEVTMEQCSQKDKEILKQTMLKHEAMFREQVRELHRLYQVQRLMMAATKRGDLAILGYPAVPSSSKDSLPSSFSSDSIKPAIETELCYAINEPLNVSRRDCKDFFLKPDQGFPTKDLGNSLSHDINNCEHSVQSPFKAARRTFDLERPAEDYMDDELEEENLQKEPMLRMGIEQNASECHSIPVNNSPGQGNEVYLRLGTGWDGNVDVLPANNPTTGLEECLRGETMLLKHQRSSEGISFFPMASMKKEHLSQETPFRPVPIYPSKSFLGGLLGLNQERWLDNVSMPGMVNGDIEDKGRKKEGLSLDLAVSERSTQGNPAQPHWPLQVLSLNRNFTCF